MDFIKTSLTLTACLMASGTLAETTIRIGHATPESSPIHEALSYFQTELEERSDGGFVVEIFPGGQIGSVQEMVELVQSGNITMTTGASVLLSSTVDELAILDQYLLFNDEAHAHDVLDGPAGAQLGAAMENRGLHSMGFMELGFRSFTNSRAPLDSLEAFDGLRIRSAANPIAIKAWQSINVVPEPLAWGEIYSSLQQGLIDGQESALSSMVVERFFEVQDYVTLTQHIYWPELWIANLDFYQGLNDDERAILDEVARETILLQRDLAAKANAETLDQLAEKGLEINELPAAARSEMGSIMNTAIADDIRTKVGEEFYSTFMSNLEQ